MLRPTCLVDLHQAQSSGQIILICKGNVAWTEGFGGLKEGEIIFARYGKTRQIFYLILISSLIFCPRKHSCRQAAGPTSKAKHHVQRAQAA
jgi:hypothetical protein